MTFPDCDADSFVAKEQIADYFAAYAKTFKAPIKTGVVVFSAERLNGRPGFRVETSLGVIEAQRIVAATGPFQRPVIPAIAAARIALCSRFIPRTISSRSSSRKAVCWWLARGRPAYKSPMSSAGRGARCGSPSARTTPRRRRYRQRDFCWWLGVLGLWDAAANQPGKRARDDCGQRRARRSYR